MLIFALFFNAKSNIIIKVKGMNLGYFNWCFDCPDLS